MVSAPLRRLILMLIFAAGVILFARVPAQAGVNCSNLPYCLVPKEYITTCTNDASAQEYYGEISSGKFGDCVYDQN